MGMAANKTNSYLQSNWKIYTKQNAHERKNDEEKENEKQTPTWINSTITPMLTGIIWDAWRQLTKCDQLQLATDCGKSESKQECAWSGYVICVSRDKAAGKCTTMAKKAYTQFSPSCCLVCAFAFHRAISIIRRLCAEQTILHTQTEFGTQKTYNTIPTCDCTIHMEKAEHTEGHRSMPTNRLAHTPTKQSKTNKKNT